MALTKKVKGKEYEVLRMPMKNVKISQGCNGQFSHQGVNALDLCGKDAGIEETLAPCSMKLVAYDTPNNGNAVFFESLNPVLFADGTIDYATFMFIHDNDISDIRYWAGRGHQWKQWEPFGDEGTAGYATGNHCHHEVAKGKFKKCYEMNAQGVWHLPNSISPDLAFVVDGCTMYYDGQPISGGNEMKWKTSNQIPNVDKPELPKNQQPYGGTVALSKDAENSLKSDPKPFDGWIKDGDHWKYKDKSGELLQSKWIKNDGGWYYFKKNGYACQSEFVEIEYNGAKQWFYFGKSCKMIAQSWFEVDGEWYYANQNGVILKEQWIPTDGEWYYVNRKCQMVKDCVLTFEGEEYIIDKKGRWQKPQPENEGSKESLIFGVDISAHNGADFPVEDYDFVIIRACYGTNTDKYFETNVKRCEKHNIPWGAYCYSYSLNAEDAEGEAEYFVNLMDGKNPTMGLWLDMEDADNYKGSRNALNRENIQAITETFMNKMNEMTDYYTGIYCNPDWLSRFVDNDGKWPQWLAWWDVDTDKYDMCVIHQYGVNNGVDANVSYLPLDTFKRK